MATLDQYLDDQLVRGRAYFTSEEALAALGLSPPALRASITRLAKKQRLANLRHGFYLILRPEDRVAGAPDPASWIDPLMRYQSIDYRISLLRAAAFHGSSHQAAMTFQVIVPKQLRGKSPHQPRRKDMGGQSRSMPPARMEGGRTGADREERDCRCGRSEIGLYAAGARADR